MMRRCIFCGASLRGRPIDARCCSPAYRHEARNRGPSSRASPRPLLDHRSNPESPSEACKTRSAGGVAWPPASIAAVPESKFAPLPGYSRGDINRAGVELRRWWQSDDPVTDETTNALVAMAVFRETFQAPLNKTAMGLRSMVTSECPELKEAGARVPVAQRLKRETQIVNKLARLGSMQLWTMGDIGGCRAVLPSRRQVDGVLRRIRKQKWTIHGKVRDYRDEPAADGYRAVHVMVIRDGRLIEVQLRDPREHEWAVAVERAGARLGIPLKEGEGPDDLRKVFLLASLGMYMEAHDELPTPEFLQEFDAARQRALPYLQGSD
jgi:putative GTP pyrophosphokinase